MDSSPFRMIVSSPRPSRSLFPSVFIGFLSFAKTHLIPQSHYDFHRIERFSPYFFFSGYTNRKFSKCWFLFSFIFRKLSRMLTIRYPESKQNENTYARYRENRTNQAKWIAQPWKYQNTIKLNTLTLIVITHYFVLSFAFSHFSFFACLCFLSMKVLNELGL